MKKYHYQQLNVTLTEEYSKKLDELKRQMDKTIPGIKKSAIARAAIIKYIDQQLGNQEHN